MSAETKATPTTTKFVIKATEDRKTHAASFRLVHKKIVGADKTAADAGDQGVFGKLSTVPTIVEQGRMRVNEIEQDVYKILFVGPMHGKPQTPKEKSDSNFVDPGRLIYMMDKVNRRILAAVSRKNVPAARAKAAKEGEDEQLVVLSPKKAVALAILAEHPNLMSENEDERRIDIEKLEVVTEAERVQKNLLARLICDVRYKTIKQLSDSTVFDDFHIVGPSVLAVPGFAQLYEKLTWKDLGVANPHPTKKAAAPKSSESEKKKSSTKTDETEEVAASSEKKKRKRSSSLATTSSVLDSIAAATDDEPIQKPKAAPEEKESTKKRQRPPTPAASAPKKGGSLYTELLELAEKAKAMETAAASSSGSTDRVDYRKKAIAYNKRMKELEAANAVLETDKKTVEERLQISEANIALKSKEIEKAKAEALEYKKACDAAKEELEKVKKQLAEASAKKDEEEEEEEDDSDLSSDDDADENEDDDDDEADENEGEDEEADESESAEDDENEGVAGEGESNSSSE